MRRTSSESIVVLLVLGFAMIWSGCTGLPTRSVGVEKPADMVVFNARIFTSNSTQPAAEALAVRGERLVYVGNDDGLATFIGPNTKRINAKNRRITPGFIDNHCHVLWIGGFVYLMPPDLYACNDHAQLAAVLKQRAAADPEMPIIGGIGWRMEKVPGGVPRKEILDDIISNRPVLLMSFSGQSGWLNSLAVRELERRDPNAFEELSPVRDENGECTGECRHFHAINIMDFYSFDDLGTKVRDGFRQSITNTLNEALSYGVTTMHDVQLYKEFLPFLIEFKRDGGLDKVRIRGAYYIPPERFEDEHQLRADLMEWKEIGDRHNDHHFNMGDSVKFYIDGTPDNHTAFFSKEYSNDRGSLGEQVWTEDDFCRVVEFVDEMGLQACTHAIGDAGIRRVVNAYENVIIRNPGKDLRHRVEHCEFPDPADIERMARLGIPAAMQPLHFFGDRTVEDGLGMERMQGYMPWRSLEKAGVRVSFGSDWCAGPNNPFYGLLIGSLRINCKMEKDWNESEKITLADGIRHWTIDSAHALRMDNDIGSIEVGKYADFVMFNQDPLRINSWWFLLTHELELGEMDHFVDLTVVGGNIMFER